MLCHVLLSPEHRQTNRGLIMLTICYEIYEVHK